MIINLKERGLNTNSFQDKKQQASVCTFRLPILTAASVHVVEVWLTRGGCYQRGTAFAQHTHAKRWFVKTFLHYTPRILTSLIWFEGLILAQYHFLYEKQNNFPIMSGQKLQIYYSFITNMFITILLESFPTVISIRGWFSNHCI
jgi:hypothetical protein